MWNLIKIVIPKIQAEWENVAYSMQYDISTVEAFKKDHRDSDICCKELLKDWLSSSRGVTPKHGQNFLKGLKMLILLKLLQNILIIYI